MIVSFRDRARVQTILRSRPLYVNISFIMGKICLLAIFNEGDSLVPHAAGDPASTNPHESAGAPVLRAFCEGWVRYCGRTSSTGFAIPHLPTTQVSGHEFACAVSHTISKLVILSGAGAHAPHSRRIPTQPFVTTPHQGVLFETPVLTFSAVRDGFYYKFWVYILVSRTGTLYIGITGYFDRRISQHKIDSIEGFTSKYKIHRLVYYSNLRSRSKCYRSRKAAQRLATGKENCKIDD
jgi:predicted GIY-YIG superfamily endonuclease